MNSIQKSLTTEPKAQEQHKMFVGGLAHWISEEDLKTHFSIFGRIEKIKIPKNPKTRISKGYCFIFFKDKEALDSVLKFPKSHKIKNRVLDCQEALGDAKNRDQQKYEEVNRRRVFIANVSPEATDKNLVDYFSKYGKLKSAYLMKEKKEKEPKIGYIVFHNSSSAQRVIHQRFHTILGVISVCESYKTRDETAKLKKKKICGSQQNLKIAKRFFKKIQKNQKGNYLGKKEYLGKRYNGLKKKFQPQICWVSGSIERKKKMSEIFKVSNSLDLCHQSNQTNDYWHGSNIRINPGLILKNVFTNKLPFRGTL